MVNYKVKQYRLSKTFVMKLYTEHTIIDRPANGNTFFFFFSADG